MTYPKPVKRTTIIKAAFTLLSLILVLIFAPRMDEPRIIDGVQFSTKSGNTGLTDLGWILLVLVPVLTYLVVSLMLKLNQKKNHGENRLD